MSIGEKVKYYRKLRNLSQLDIELETNLSTGTISRIENNQVNPTKETIFAIAKTLQLTKIDVAYLLGIVESEYITKMGTLNENF
jgi:transcriptional regulator with XRE-family HTH domain